MRGGVVNDSGGGGGVSTDRVVVMVRGQQIT
jgi:hypothetical protein